MGEINSAQYSSVFPRFLLSLGFHPLGEDAKSCESPWLLVETAFFTPLSVDLGYPFVSLLARTGLRLHEAIALQWGDIDFNGRFLTVQRNFSHKKLDTPKNGKSRRVDLSAQLTETLRALLLERKKETLRK